MKNKGFLTVITLSLITLSGCAMNYPQTADEYRQAAPNGMLTEKVEVDVKRPIDAIGRDFEKKSDECLNVTITSTHMTRGAGTYYEKQREKYLLSNVTVKKDAVEMIIREKFGAGWAPVGMPEDGYFYFVVDATPVNSQSSHLVIYRPKIMYKSLAQAIVDWANGKTQGCPDLTN
ncbi:MAG: hypothetical protein LPK43_01275 [Gammaproteobacteria bacterium]|nr:hypothetical protein [Gammaproteobacteria bacterium]